MSKIDGYIIRVQRQKIGQKVTANNAAVSLGCPQV